MQFNCENVTGFHELVAAIFARQGIEVNCALARSDVKTRSVKKMPVKIRLENSIGRESITGAGNSSLMNGKFKMTLALVKKFLFTSRNHNRMREAELS